MKTEPHENSIVLDSGRPRVAVCFFGIPRSLRFTQPSIIRNILEPINRFAEVRVFVHFFDQKEVNNPRTGERGEMCQESIIQPNQTLVMEKPDLCLNKWSYEDLKLYGDYWSDEFKSLRNLIHQLHSIREVTLLSQAFNADCTVFVRPDLWYYDDLSPTVLQALSKGHDTVYLPYWQKYGGENDRFAVVGKNCVKAYGYRIQSALNFCKLYGSSLHSESLLKFSLSDTKVTHIPCRAARVRINGETANETFGLDWIEQAHQRVILSGTPHPVSSALHSTFKLFQRIKDYMDNRKPVPKSPSGQLSLAFPETSVKSKFDHLRNP